MPLVFEIINYAKHILAQSRNANSVRGNGTVNLSSFPQNYFFFPKQFDRGSALGYDKQWLPTEHHTALLSHIIYLLVLWTIFSYDIFWDTWFQNASITKYSISLYCPDVTLKSDDVELIL